MKFTEEREKMETKVDVRLEARKRLLHGLFTTALEGGIGYWCACSEYRWMLNPDEPAEMPVEDLDGFKAVLHPSPPEEFWMVDGVDDEKPLTVDLAVMWLGLERWIEWMTTDLRNRLGGLVEPAAEQPWRRDPFRPASSYWRQFASDAKFNRLADADYDANLADAVVQLGLFNEVVFG